MFLVLALASLRLAIAGMQARGASTLGAPLWAVALLVAVFIGLSVRSGSFLLSGIRPLERHQQPGLFWGLMATLALIASVFVGAIWLDAHSPLYLGHP